MAECLLSWSTGLYGYRKSLTAKPVFDDAEFCNPGGISGLLSRLHFATTDQKRLSVNKPGYNNRYTIVIRSRIAAQALITWAAVPKRLCTGRKYSGDEPDEEKWNACRQRAEVTVS